MKLAGYGAIHSSSVNVDITFKNVEKDVPQFGFKRVLLSNSGRNEASKPQKEKSTGNILLF